MNPRLGAVVLAAGASIRMGEPKQLLSIHGKPLLRRTVDAVIAHGGMTPVIVVLGAHAARIRPALADLPANVHLVENSGWESGMASSLTVGLRALLQLAPEIDAALFALGDQPLFSEATVQALVAGLTAPGKTIAAAAYDGQIGAPAIFHRAHFGELAQLSGAQGARVVIARHAAAVTAVSLPDLALDLDTPADVAAWRARDTTQPTSVPATPRASS